MVTNLMKDLLHVMTGILKNHLVPYHISWHIEIFFNSQLCDIEL